MSTDRLEAGSPLESEYIPFSTAGQSGKGEYRCSECSYGVTVHTTLPLCPMCSSSSWERAAWSPFSRATRSGQHGG